MSTEPPQPVNLSRATAETIREAAKAGPANLKMLQYVFDQYGKKIGVMRKGSSPYRMARKMYERLLKGGETETA